MPNQILSLKQFAPGYVPALPGRDNGGFATFENLLLNSIGKVKKRLSWKIPNVSGSVGWNRALFDSLADGGASVQYDSNAYNPYDATNAPYPEMFYTDINQRVDWIAGPTDIHKQPGYMLQNGVSAYRNFIYQQFGSSDPGQLGDRFIEHSKGKTQIIWGYSTPGTLSETDINTLKPTTSYQVADATNFPGNNPVQFIKTNDQIYIINAFTDTKAGDTGGYVYKLLGLYGSKYNAPMTARTAGSNPAYNPQLRPVFIPKYDTVTQDKFEIKPSIIYTTTGGAIKEAWSYKYKIVPVYNTGTFLPPMVLEIPAIKPNTYTVTSTNKTWFITWNVTSTTYTTLSQKTKNLNIAIPALHDPHIAFFRVYRAGQKFDISKNMGQNMDLVAQLPYKFVAQIEAKGSFRPLVFNDSILEDALGDELVENKYLNEVPVTVNFDTSTIDYLNVIPDSTYINVPYTQDSKFTDPSQGIRASCGCFAEGRLILGNINKVYISDIDNTDGFKASATLFIPDASIDNPITLIQPIAGGIIVQTKLSTHILRATYDKSVPYLRTLLIAGYGCDKYGCGISLNNLVYFLYQNQIKAVDSIGQIHHIGAGIDSELKNIDTSTSPGIKFYLDGNGPLLRVTFRTDDKGNFRTLNYDPKNGLWNEEAGYTYHTTPIYKTTANAVIYTVEPKVKRFGALGFCYVPELGEAWGVTPDYTFIRRSALTSDYNDTGLAPKQSGYDFYIVENFTAPDILFFYSPGYLDTLNTYPVETTLTKLFPVPAKVMINSVVIPGDCPLKLAFARDNGTLKGFRGFLARRIGHGTEMLIGCLSNWFQLSLLHDTAADIDIDTVSIKITADRKVDEISDFVSPS